jgi:DNA repair exonuclease SbcCD nuclease subunit
MIKILAIGDTHIKTNNIPDIEIFLSELETLLKNENFDFIVNMGDLLDTHAKLDTTCLNKANEFFRLLSSYSHLFSIVGNHDFISNSQFLTNRHWLQSFKDSKFNMTIVDNIIVYQCKEKYFILCPYIPEGRFNEAIQTSEKAMELLKEGKISCLFVHQTFNNAKMGSVISKDTDDWTYSAPIISGHIHESQRIKTENSFIYYTGSSLQHNFGESSKKHLARITIHPSSPLSIDEIKLNIPIRKIKNLSLSKIDKYIQKNIEKIKSEMLKVKIHITNPIDEYKLFRKSKEYNKYTRMGIKFDHKSIETSETIQDPKITEIIKEEKVDKLDFYNILEKYVKDDENINKLYQELKSNIKPIIVDREEESEDESELNFEE